MIIGEIGVPHGKISVSVTSITLVNNTAKTVDLSTSSGKRRRLLSVSATNPDDVNRQFYLTHYKEGGKTTKIQILLDVAALAASGGRVEWPNTMTDQEDNSPAWHPVITLPSHVWSAIWEAGGASAGGTDADGLICVYLEINV